MNTEIKNLEAKINELEMRINNAQDNDNLKLDLNNLINEFKELKTKILNEETTIDSEKIEDLSEIISQYITECASKKFRNETYSQYDIDNVEFWVNYDSEIELESATINIKDYFQEYVIFNYDQFKRFLNENSKYTETQKQVIELIPTELFQLISEIIFKSVDEIDTNISFDNFEDFECDLCYKRIEVTSVDISSYEFEKKFFDDFDYDSKYIEDIIKLYHNLEEEKEEEE